MARRLTTDEVLYGKVDHFYQVHKRPFPNSKVQPDAEARCSAEAA